MSQPGARGAGRLAHAPHARSVTIPAGDATLDGDLVVPEGAVGVVLFAHGSGSSRTSPRNRAVAALLHSAGLATLLIDLLTVAEDEKDRAGGTLRFDIPFLAVRLGAAAGWLGADEDTRALPLGLFGASTGAGAALVLAARQPDAVAAVVSRGGRPDLARGALAHVRAPTLLIVGEADHDVVALNRAALAAMSCERQLVLVPGATHLFEEPGALEAVARHAAGWFGARLRR